MVWQMHVRGVAGVGRVRRDQNGHGHPQTNICPCLSVPGIRQPYLNELRIRILQNSAQRVQRMVRLF